MSDDDTTHYLINLMPKGLGEGGRRIKHELTLVGRQHDFMYVLQKCGELVREETKSVHMPAFPLTEADLANHDLAMMVLSTGMLLVDPSSPSSLQVDTDNGSAFIAGSEKWCPDCPHGGKSGKAGDCFSDPAYTLGRRRSSCTPTASGGRASWRARLRTRASRASPTESRVHEPAGMSCEYTARFTCTVDRGH
jgi:hypothetical protein